MDREIESILREDEIEKKRAGRGMYNKTNFTRNRNGGMPSDMLKGKALKAYKGNSEVTVYNLNDAENSKHTIPGDSRKKTTAEDDAYICKMYQDGEKISAITKKYGISAPVVYSILKKNGVVKRGRMELPDVYSEPTAARAEVGDEPNKVDRIKTDIVRMLIRNELSYAEAVQTLKAARGELRQRKLV